MKKFIFILATVAIWATGAGAQGFLEPLNAELPGGSSVIFAHDNGNSLEPISGPVKIVVYTDSLELNRLDWSLWHAGLTYTEPSQILGGLDRDVRTLYLWNGLPWGGDWRLTVQNSGDTRLIEWSALPPTIVPEPPIPVLAGVGGVLWLLFFTFPRRKLGVRR